MAQRISQPRKRTSGKLATTTFVNEVVDYVGGNIPPITTGQAQPEFPHSMAQLVKVTSAASGGGKYNGRVWLTPATALAATGTLSEADLGVTDGADCLIYNAAEVGQATHDLTDGTPKSKILPAIFRGHTSTGIMVFAINGYDFGNCS